MPYRYCLALLLAAATLAARAQTAPIIGSADLPAVGDTLRLSQAAALPASAPALTLNGANRTWNYAALVPIAQRVARFNATASATGALVQFTFNSPLSPDNRANLVSPQLLPAGTGTALPVTDPQEFFNNSATDFRSVGFAGTYSGTAIPVTYASRAQQDVVYRLPLAYGSAATVSNSLLTTPTALASSGYFSQRRQRTVLVDGWGTITTPYGTYVALRTVTTLNDHDSLAVNGQPGQGLTLPTRREYTWLAAGVHAPILTITTTAVGTTEQVSAVEYRDVYRKLASPLAAQGAAPAPAELAAYPNPSAVGTALHLALPAGSGAGQVRATDLAGRLVFSRQLAAGAADLTLEAAAFGEFRGVLLLTVQTSQGTATRRVVRQ